VISVACIYAAIAVPDVDGVQRSPLDLHGNKAAVLIFVGVDCPISNSYAPEINRIAADYSKKGLDFYIVYSEANLSAANAKKHSDDFGYACPSLMDRQQVLMKSTKAKVTPQAVVMGPDAEILYSGRIDNWYEDFGKQRFKPTTHDLRDALDAIVAGKKVAVPVTKAIGCPV
jgi:predicted ATP-grasp superfamily ATP-dependent carboligase